MQPNKTPKIFDQYKVLIIEDDKGLNKLIKSKLERNGMRASQAYTGKEGLNKAIQNEDVLILLDYILPDMKGKEVIKILREKDQNRPFVVVTGHGDERLAVDMMKMGAKDYLVKNDGFLDLMPTVVSNVLKDIYHEKRMKQMQEHNKYLSLVTRQIFEPIFITDNDFKITFANKAAQQVYGVTEQELQGQSIFKLYVNEDSDELKSRIKDSIQDGSKWRQECDHINEKGKKFTSIDSVSELQEDGKEGLIFIHYDIMDRKKVEEKKDERLETLKANLERLKNSEELLPMCSSCKKIRNEDDSWVEVENYLREYTDLDLTHGICPNCIQELYPDFSIPEQDSSGDN